MRTYLQHGRRHGAQGSDPIPGLNNLPTAVAECDSTITIAGGATSDIAWDDVEISDGSVFSWTSGQPVKALVEGLYMAWLMIAPDSVWPTAASTGWVLWAVTASGAGNIGLGGFQPFGGHPYIDTFAPSGHEAGQLVPSTIFHNIEGAVPSSFSGHIDNTPNSASFVVSEPSYMVIVKLGDPAFLS